MKFLLSKEEYEELVNRAQKKEKALKETLQDLCTKVCDHMPVKWSNSKEKPSPWNCIISNAKRYCDDCPVQKVCPNEYKDWSK